MALLDLWDYVRASGDRRLRQQGYVQSGMGILERYRKSASYWAPHLERNRGGLLRAAELLDEKRGGTLMILGAGRLLDVPWEQIFPRFERIVLLDADFCVVPYVERVIAASRVKEIPKPQFEIGDLTASVVDTAAWAEHAIHSARSAAAAADELARGFNEAGTPQAPWARAFSDIRMIVSTNLMSQLGYYPRRHIQNVFKKRFDQPFEKYDKAAGSLERYFDRVRARHIHDLASQRGAIAYASSDISVLTYQVRGRITHNLLAEAAPSDAGVSVDDKGEPIFKWPVEIVERSDPLNGQKIRDLWPQGSALSVERWAWHIVPQGAEAKYQDRGRVHVVEGWTRRIQN
ncbi:MAG TPA: hypothetical protein VKX17_03765 [Planctomycetota bacterium]|nr:hypothetical protein [Planctomycetota bacterium]